MSYICRCISAICRSMRSNGDATYSTPSGLRQHSIAEGAGEGKAGGPRHERWTVANQARSTKPWHKVAQGAGHTCRNTPWPAQPGGRAVAAQGQRAPGFRRWPATAACSVRSGAGSGCFRRASTIGNGGQQRGALDLVQAGTAVAHLPSSSEQARRRRCCYCGCHFRRWFQELPTESAG